MKNIYSLLHVAKIKKLLKYNNWIIEVMLEMNCLFYTRFLLNVYDIIQYYTGF